MSPYIAWAMRAPTPHWEREGRLNRIEAWARSAMTAAATPRMKYGSFWSTTPQGAGVNQPRDWVGNRRRGYQSRTSRTTKNVMPQALERRESSRSAMEARYQAQDTTDMDLGGQARR